jgi:hypothetical protein
MVNGKTVKPTQKRRFLVEEIIRILPVMAVINTLSFPLSYGFPLD